jgi:YD repeat-containing protein
LGRKYSSQFRVGGWFGPSWSSVWDERVEVDASGVTRVTSDAKVVAYPLPDSGAGSESGVGGSVLPVRGERWPLRRVGAAFSVTDPWSGVVRHYAAPVAGALGVAGAAVGVQTFPLVAVTDRAGFRIDVDRDEAGRPVGMRHSGGYRIAVDLDAARTRVAGYRLLPEATNTTDAGVVLAGFGYDRAGDLVEVTGADEPGAPTRFVYDGAHRLVRWEDANGGWFTYVYDDQNRCVSSVGPGGALSASFSYLPVATAAGEPDGHVTSFTDATGAVTRYRINPRFQIVSVTDPVGAVTASVWDEADRLVARTDPLGRQTRFTYDQAGDLVEVALADGGRVVAGYDAEHLPVEVVDADGAVRRFAYDGAGRVVEQIAPDGAVTRFAHDLAEGLPAPGVVATSRVTDPAGGVSWVGLDGAGLPVVVVDPGGAWTRYVRDGAGRVIQRTDADGNVTRFGYTPGGRLSWAQHPDGARETWVWDAEGNLVSHTDPAGAVNTWEYTHFNMTAAHTGPDGARHAYGYDALMRLTQVSGPTGLAWTYELDPAGRLVAETDFNGATTRYERDPAGQTVGVVNAAGQAARYDLDAAGRMVAVSTGEGTTTYDWDRVGRLLRARGPGVELTRSFDAGGRLTSETTNGRTLTYAYDGAGRRVGVRTPGGVVQSWALDARGLPTHLTLNTTSGTGTNTSPGAGAGTGLGVGGAGYVLGLAHDRLGRLTAVDYPGVDGSGGLRVGRRWDARGRLSAAAATVWAPDPATGEEPVKSSV